MSATAVLEKPAPAAPDLSAVKQRQQGAWSSGDYAVVGTTLADRRRTALRGARPAPRQPRCSTWRPATAMSRSRRRAAGATSPRPTTCRRCSNAAASGRPPSASASNSARPTPRRCRFRDASFDVVVSTFGVMFTPDQDKAAAELMRVCKPGGKIGLANWTPEGFIGQLFKTLGKHMPPPAGVKSPALWGTRARLNEMFGDGAASIDAQPRMFVFRYRSPQHWLDVFRNFYGPIHKAFGAMDSGKQDALAADLMALVAEFNRATDGTMAVHSEYLEVVVTR